MPEYSKEQLIFKRRAIQKITLLPSIPVVLLKILESSSNPKSSAQDLEDIIIKDQSISAAILKLANSAFYGYAKTVEDVGRAVVLIGFNTAVSVAISVSVLKTVSEKVKGVEFNRDDFWRHTIAAGEAARILSEQIKYEFVSRAYMIGLVHDIGKVVLSYLNSTDFDDAVFEARVVYKPLYECEMKIFGFDHQDAGRWLGERWQLPEYILAGIQYHHRLDHCPEQYKKEAAIGHAANYLAKIAQIGNSGDELVPELNEFAAKKLKLTPAIIDYVKNDLIKSKEEIDNFVQSIQ